MRFLSVCSGIEAASVAFKPLGWTPLAFSEIEAFPRALLAHHYPDVPCHGDFTELKAQPWIVDADLLCGGTPCQSFSVAGLRQSLSDGRGNLSLEFILLANAIDDLRSTAGRQPAWILWENVPGVLSTKDNAFGAFLGGLCGRDAAIPEPADGWPDAGVADGPTRCAAWRILDAQHFGLAQRRKRVFVLALGGAGRWAVADALLPIIESSGWHPAPSRGKGEGSSAAIAPSLTASGRGVGRTGESRGQDPVIAVELPEVTRPLTAAMGTKWNGNGDIESSLIPEVTHTLKGEGFDASEDGTGRGVPLIAGTMKANSGGGGWSNSVDHAAGSYMVPVEAPILVRMRECCDGGGKGPLVSEDQSLTLATSNDQFLAFHENQRAEVTTNDTTGALGGGGGKPGQGYPAALQGMQVRRLTPRECERLQGFPDDYTLVPIGKKMAADGPRYKALGNSWAVPVVNWIGRRIEQVNEILSNQQPRT